MFGCLLVLDCCLSAQLLLCCLVVRVSSSLLVPSPNRLGHLGNRRLRYLSCLSTTLNRVLFSKKSPMYWGKCARIEYCTLPITAVVLAVQLSLSMIVAIKLLHDVRILFLACIGYCYYVVSRLTVFNTHAIDGQSRYIMYICLYVCLCLLICLCMFVVLLANQILSLLLFVFSL